MSKWQHAMAVLCMVARAELIAQAIAEDDAVEATTTVRYVALNSVRITQLRQRIEALEKVSLWGLFL